MMMITILTKLIMLTINLSFELVPAVSLLQSCIAHLSPPLSLRWSQFSPLISTLHTPTGDFLWKLWFTTCLNSQRNGPLHIGFAWNYKDLVCSAVVACLLLSWVQLISSGFLLLLQYSIQQYMSLEPIGLNITGVNIWILALAVLWLLFWFSISSNEMATMYK